MHKLPYERKQQCWCIEFQKMIHIHIEMLMDDREYSDKSTTQGQYQFIFLIFYNKLQTEYCLSRFILH